MKKLIVKSWGDFQHYKDRSPPWIKLHKGLLDNYEYQRLPIASRAIAPMIWLLASESADGSIEYDIDKLAFRLRQPTDDVKAGIDPLISSGFLIVTGSDSNVIAPRSQDACLETEAEREKEEEREAKTEGAPAPGDEGGFSLTGQEPKEPKPKKAKAAKAGFDPLAIDIPPQIPEWAWEDWVAYRKDRRLPAMTEQTCKAQIGNLLDWAAKGMPPEDVIRQSIANGWQGLFELKQGGSRQPFSRQAQIEANNRAAMEEFLNGSGGEAGNIINGEVVHD